MTRPSKMRIGANCTMPLPPTVARGVAPRSGRLGRHAQETREREVMEVSAYEK